MKYLCGFVYILHIYQYFIKKMLGRNPACLYCIFFVNATLASNLNVPEQAFNTSGVGPILEYSDIQWGFCESFLDMS